MAQSPARLSLPPQRLGCWRRSACGWNAVDGPGSAGGPPAATDVSTSPA
jgi:hypothetical protein